MRRLVFCIAILWLQAGITKIGAETCKAYDFECADGQCKNRGFDACDVYKVCDNGKEACNGKCADYLFQCANGKCIPTYSLCNGVDHCGDNSDENYCTKIDGCFPHQFKCGDGQCISKRWACDVELGRCADESDEVNCKASANGTCPDFLFQCRNGNCAPQLRVCNDFDDCGDNSDEDFCKTSQECPPYTFQCESGGCLSSWGLCNDGLGNCADGSDDKFCKGRCPKNYFQCLNGFCVPSRWRCDGYPQCWDQSDEFRCPGGFGKFQFLTVAIILFPEWPGAMLELQPIFTGAHPTKWTCTTGDVTVDVTNEPEALCSCNGTLDGGSDSIVGEWNLVCEYAWVVDFITSIQMVGMIAGDVFGTICADKYGRKNTLYASNFMAMAGSLMSSLATSPIEYAFARFFVGAGVSAIMVLGVYYAMEFLTPKWRMLSGAAGLWGEGVMTLAILAYFYQSWRHLCVATAFPMLFFILTYPFLPESPRWLIANGKVDEAKDVIDKIAKWNGYPRLRGGIMDNLTACIKSDEDEECCGGADDESKGSVGFRTFLNNAECMRRTMILMFAWFTCSLLYYGIGFNIKNLSGDPYWNVVYVALVDMIGFRSAIFVSPWLGRKKSFIFYMGTSAFCMVNVILMEEGLGLEKTELRFNLLSFGGKMCAAAAMGVVECFTAESYPTYARSLGVGFSNFAGSIGAIFAPQMAFLGSIYKIGPYFIFSFFAVICTWMTLFLSETNGRPIQESF